MKLKIDGKKNYLNEPVICIFLFLFVLNATGCLIFGAICKDIICGIQLCIVLAVPFLVLAVFLIGSYFTITEKAITRTYFFFFKRKTSFDNIKKIVIRKTFYLKGTITIVEAVLFYQNKKSISFPFLFDDSKVFIENIVKTYNIPLEDKDLLLEKDSIEL